ncbi:UNKNOWN [Stylonychia lemnae]|uniref:Uncharacterized protein n=1 Tax=Stylonychia lemnae TaxID=5949 RepID=A0A078A0X2_STYLE|nr:UNKNOWN [Stylonychia lemnae]|eukprot:CDW75128.1 UNKNOWN [Stylonychia lemnae]
MVDVFTTRMTKKLDHASIVINRFQGTRQEISKLCDVVSYLIRAGSQVIQIHDITKKLHNDRLNMQQQLKRRIDTAAFRHKKGLFQIIESKEEDVIRIKYQKAENADLVETLIVYINEQQNLDDVLRLSQIIGKEKKAKKLNFTCHSSSQVQSVEDFKEGKKQKYEQLENYMHQNLKCYQYVKQNSKISHNPQVVLAFNSQKDILELPGFPMLQKEIAEIFQCGSLLNYRAIDFINNIERYSSIQQRWGL